MFGKVYKCPCSAFLRTEILGGDLSKSDFDAYIQNVCNDFCLSDIAANTSDVLIKLSKSSRYGYFIEHKNIRKCDNCNRIVKPVSSIVKEYNTKLRETESIWRSVLTNCFTTSSGYSTANFVYRVLDRIGYDVTSIVKQFGANTNSMVTSFVVGCATSYSMREHVSNIDALYLALTEDELKNIGIDAITWKIKLIIESSTYRRIENIPWEGGNGIEWLKERFDMYMIEQGN